RSVLADSNPERGWFGTLDRPVTLDVLFGRSLVDPLHPTHVLRASVDALAANGIAIRSIETPSLVYPPQSVAAGGTFTAPGYAPSDAAFLEAEAGDVVLLGNDNVIELGATPSQSASSAPTETTRILPPFLRVTTHHFCPTCAVTRGLEDRGGDLVL